MTWTKLSDDYTDDTWTLSDAAFRLHTEGLVWSNRKLTDLLISDGDLRRFAKSPEAVSELLTTGYWKQVEGGYIIRHHGTYQRKKEAVLKQQEANRRNGRRGGEAKAADDAAAKKMPREQWGTSSEPSSNSPSDSLSERDRTGQAGDEVNTHNNSDSVEPPEDPFEVRDGEVFDPESGRWRKPAFDVDSSGASSWEAESIPADDAGSSVDGGYCRRFGCSEPAMSGAPVCAVHAERRYRRDAA